MVVVFEFLGAIDEWWQASERDSFALQGVVAIDGGGKDKAPLVAEHLCDLGYDVWLLLDSDEAPNETALTRAKEKGAKVHQWAGECSTEERLFLDLPWVGVRAMIKLAVEHVGQASVMAVMDRALSAANLPTATEAKLGADRDKKDVRRILGKVANDKGWFKDISRGERLAAIIGPFLETILMTPLATGIEEMRSWVDGQ